MKKNHLILVCICTVILLLLGTSTAVVGYQSIQRTGDQARRTSQSADFFSYKVPSDLNTEDRLRHPVLCLMVWLFVQWYLFRGWILYEFSISVGAFNWIEIDYPLVFLRACFLIFVGSFWLKFWQQLSSAFGWNWSLETSPW